MLPKIPINSSFPLIKQKKKQRGGQEKKVQSEHKFISIL